MGTCCYSKKMFCKFWNNICKTLFASESHGVVLLEVSLSLPAEHASWPGSDTSSRGEVERWVISPDGHSRERGSMRGSYFDKTITAAVQLNWVTFLPWADFMQPPCWNRKWGSGGKKPGSITGVELLYYCVLGAVYPVRKECDKSVRFHHFPRYPKPVVNRL